jgi:hypothetical protein
VDRPPFPRVGLGSEPLAEDARYDDQEDEVRSDRPQADVEGPERRQERYERVDDVHPLREDLGGDVDDQERERAEGYDPVCRLDENPVPRAEDHPVGGD